MNRNKVRDNSNQLIGGFAYFLRILGLVVGYAVVGCLSQTLDPPATTLIWPASGFALALLLRWGIAYWPGVFLGALAVYFIAGFEPFAMLGLALGNTGSAVFGAVLINKQARFNRQLSRPGDVAVLVGYGAILSTLVSAAMLVLVLIAGDPIEAGSVPLAFLDGWLGAVTGVLVFAPVILSFADWRETDQRSRAIHFPVLMVVTLAVSSVVFLQGWFQLPIAFLVFPCIFYACKQFGAKGASMITLLIAFIAVLGSTRALGPFVAESSRLSVLLVWGFITFCALSSLVMTALLSGGRHQTEPEGEGQMAERNQSPPPLQDEPEAAEAKMRTLLESAPDAILIMDTRSKIIQANKATEALFGYDHKALISGSFNLLFPDRFGDTERTHVEGLLAKPDRHLTGGSFELVGATKDGKALHEEVRFGSFEVGDEPRITCFIRDLTKRRQQEEKRRKLESKRCDTQKLESLGLLAGGIAHDFNNLLMGILGNASIVLEDLPGDSGQRTHVERIQTAGMRSGELTRQLLAYAGKGTFVVEPLNLTALVEEMAQPLKISISSGGVLEMELNEELPTIQADATQLRQVIMNLISNASDSLPGGRGLIRIRTGVRVYDREALEFCYMADETRPGNYVFLEVSDQGTGLDLRTRAKIFDPFFTTKLTGRGLGLAAVQGIVKGHGGAIEVASRLGQGTTFRLLFPPHSQVAPTKTLSRVKPSNWRGQGTVLVIDDEEFVLHFTSDTLKRYGFAPILAKNGDEGIRIFGQFSEEIRLVLLDMTMPGKSGEEVYEEIHRLNPTVPIVLSSGHCEQDALDHFKGKELAGYLQKPYGVRVLRELLYSLLA